MRQIWRWLMAVVIIFGGIGLFYVVSNTTWGPYLAGALGLIVAAYLVKKAIDINEYD